MHPPSRRRACIFTILLAILPACGEGGPSEVEEDEIVEVDVEVDDVTAATVLTAAGSAACALDLDGKVHCWGSNSFGQGGRSGGDSSTPVAMEGDRVFVTISLGPFHGCGLDQAGHAFCWGNEGEQLGFEQPSPPGPAPVAPDLTFTQIDLGFAHACALATDGTAHCWGENWDGQLGSEDYVHFLGPTQVGGSHVFNQISAGRDHSCGLDGEGVAWCWGANGYGQLGIGSAAVGTHTGVPTRVVGDYAYEWLIAGDYRSCGLVEGGKAWCWGSDDPHVSGSGTLDSAVPVPVGGDERFAQLALAIYYACGVGAQDRVYCWGWNHAGQFGDGTTASSELPTRGGSDYAFRQVAVGHAHTCGSEVSGKILCWGFNDRGAVGLDAATAQSVDPVEIPGSWQ